MHDTTAGALLPLNLLLDAGVSPAVALAAFVRPLTPEPQCKSCESRTLTIKELLDPFTEDCEVVGAVDFSHAEGKAMFWHSTAHLLGAAMEELLGDAVWLCDGPSVLLRGDGAVPAGAGGFFYEAELRGDAAFGVDVVKDLRARMQKMVKADEGFERMEVSVEEARVMFRENPHKLHVLDGISARGEPVRVYKVGNFVDLCRGPHVPRTGLLGKVKVLDTGASHDKVSGALLHRVYGTGFPSKAELKDWEERTQEAAKRDHRVIGAHQKLFMFSDYSPGSAFLLPHGCEVFNRLMALLRECYVRYGYEEVSSPLIYSTALWEKSGHDENYAENMYAVKGMVEEEEEEAADGMGLKPMNCPGHCLIYAHALRSYRDLPMRLADFSALHRNEFSGALGGMTRLRRFHQDDAHIFCREDQVEEEIKQCLSFVKEIYSMFGFEFRTRCSTRPDKSIGEETEWEKAERALEAALESMNMEWEKDEGEGAFYGPKIDVAITDAVSSYILLEDEHYRVLYDWNVTAIARERAPVRDNPARFPNAATV